MTALTATLLYAAPDIAVAVAAAATAKTVDGGGPAKPGSKPPLKIGVLNDLNELAHLFARVTGLPYEYTITDPAALWDTTERHASLAKNEPADTEAMQELTGLLQRLNRQYPRRDDGTEHETPCIRCGHARIVTLPIDNAGDPLTHVCTDCGHTYDDQRLAATRALAAAFAKAETRERRRAKKALAHLEAKYARR